MSPLNTGLVSLLHVYHSTMAEYKVTDNVARRTDKHADPPIQPVEYEKHIYQQGLKYHRPLLTFQTGKWQVQAEERMSAEARGYVRITVSNLLCNLNNVH